MGAELDYFEDEAGESRYRIKGGNGEGMTTSEGYTTEWSAKRGYSDLRRAILEIEGLSTIADLIEFREAH